MNNILIIEDDKDISELIRTALLKEGYICTQAFSGKEGIELVGKQPFSLVLLDLMLPGMSGEDVLSEIRAADGNIPVIVVSAKSGLDSKVGLLRSGVDDYITKPFELRELAARVDARLRKAAPAAATLAYNGFILDRAANCVRYEDRRIPLTRQEFRILELLFSHPSRIFSKQEIYSYAWDGIYIGEDKTINVHIGNIRRKLRTVCEKEIIETVWGIGFKLA